MRNELLGSPENKIWVISSCPKRGDTGMPMSSSVGKTFVSYLVANNISLHEVRFDYLVPAVPPPGKIKKGIQHFKDNGRLLEELALLKTRIQTYKPNIILGLGADVLEHLLGNKNMNKWRGHVIWSDELGCKVLITYEPFAAFTQKRVPKEQKPGQYMTLMQADIRKAIIESKTPDMQHAEPELIIAPSYEQTVKELERMIHESKIISYDIEVFKPYEGRLIDCIGLCDNTGRAICIPFYIQNDDNSILRYFKEEHENLTVWQLVKQLMESNIPKIAQNSSFDTTMLWRYYGIKVENMVWDTMVMQHCLYCDLPKDLGTLISLYTQLPYHKYMIHESGSVSRWKYNAADAVANLHVMQGQIKEIYDIEQMPCPKLEPTGEIPTHLFKMDLVCHYYSVCNPAIHSCVYMHIAGVRIDMSLREKVIELETGYMKQLQDAINSAIPRKFHKDEKKVDTFNPKSSQQKGLLFYEVFNCKHQRNRGKITTDKHALRKFQDDPREYVKTMATACLESKAADSRLLKFKVEPDRGYIRTKYDVTGTDTGRLASGENRDTTSEGKVVKHPVIPGETNLQNIEVGPQREMIIPEDGEELAHVDLYAAEAYLNALDAGEIDMLKMISGIDENDVTYAHGMRIMTEETAKHYKIHNWMQRVTRESWFEECEAANYTYKLAKQTIHGLNYNVQPPMMSRESGLSMDVTGWQYAMYHSKFPGIKARMSRINTELKRTKSLTTLLGRRRFFLQDICPELFNVAYAWPSQSTIGEITICAQNYLHYISDMHEAGMDVPFCRPTMNTHDGLALRVKRGTRQDVIPYICKAFNIPMLLHGISITIPVSIGWGDNFNENNDELVYFYDLNLETQCL